MEKIREYLRGGGSSWSGMITLSSSDQRNAYQQKAPLGAKSVLLPYNASWHLYQILSIGDPTMTILAGPSVVGEEKGGNMGSVCTTEIC